MIDASCDFGLDIVTGPVLEYTAVCIADDRFVIPVSFHNAV